MYKSLFFIPVTLLLLTSCSIDWNNDKDKKIEALERQVTEFKNTTASGMIVFEKKMRCGTLVSEIQTKIDSINKEYANLGKFSLGGIFYSPLRDACLWIRLTDTYASDGSAMERRSLYQFWDDAGGAEPIIGCEKLRDDVRGVDTCAKWDTELKKLRWESSDTIIVP